MLSNKTFKILTHIILILIIIFLVGKIEVFMNHFKHILSIVLIPLLMGGFLYYIFRPIVRNLEKIIKNKILAIIITYILIVFFISLLLFYSGNVIQTQIQNLISQSSNFYNSAWENINKLFTTSLLENLKFEDKLASFADKLLKNIENNLVQFFSAITNIGTILILIPFVLFYFLKDDKQIFQNIIKIFPADKQDFIRKLLLDIDSNLQVYISGRLLVVLVLGILTFTGYLIVDIPNALILTIIAAITSLIPIIGPVIGILPAIFIALTVNLLLTLKVLIVMLIVQQLEGNVIQPNIQGGRLHIHPLIVIFLVIIFILLFGFLGALFAVPAYVVFRVIVSNLRNEEI